jgi:hypothetical protein
MDPSKLGDLGLEDGGKWMPFIFDMDMIEAAKLTSDEEDLPTYGCTTIFSKHGEAYIIDTPYQKFFKLLKEFYEGNDPRSDDDIIL